MKLFIGPLLILMSSAYAQKAKVLIVDPDIETKELEKNFEVQRPSHPYSLPSKQKRDEVFEGIESLKNYDELKKDILFMDLKSKSIKEIKAKYPDLSPQDLKIIMGRK